MTKKKSPQQITVPTRTLHWLLKPVIPCADSTGMLPVLNAVQVELRNDYLLAFATDRFRLGICRQQLTADDSDDAPAEAAEFKALIRLADVQHILKLFPSTRGSDSSVQLTIDGDRLHAQSVDGLGLGFTDLRVSYSLVDDVFPDVEGLAHKELGATGDPQPVTAVSPELLMSFKAAVLGRHQILELFAPKQPGRPLICRVEDHFLGLLMPRKSTIDTRRDESEPEAPAWSDVLRPSKKTEAAA